MTTQINTAPLLPPSDLDRARFVAIRNGHGAPDSLCRVNANHLLALITQAATGLGRYMTTSERLADDAPVGRLAYVAYEGGSETHADNGWWQKVAAGTGADKWGRASWVSRDLIAAVQPLVDAAAASAALASDAVATILPWRTPAAIDAALERIFEVTLLEQIGGVVLAWPDKIVVRECARRGADNRGRFRLSSFNEGAGTYGDLARESLATAAWIDLSGMSGEILLPLYNDWAGLGVAVGTIVGYMRVDVTGSFGTYFDLKYDWAEAGLLRHKILPTAAANQRIDERIDAKIAARNQVAEAWSICADPYARSLFGDAAIAGLDYDDKPFVNLETIWYPSIPLARIRFYLHSSKIGGGAVAMWSWQDAAIPAASALPKEIQLSMRADGSPISGVDTNGNALQDVGVTAHIVPDWSKLNWTKEATTYTSAAQCAVSPRIIVTADEIERRWLARTVEPRRRITVGPTRGDFPTLVAAVQAYENADAVPVVTRSMDPVSNFIGPVWPALFDVIDPLTEAVGNFQHAGIWQSQLRAPHGSVFRLRADTHLFKAPAAAGNSAPTVENNFTSAWLANGALIENQDDQGYVFHIDCVNSGVARHPNDGVLRRRIQNIVEGARIRTAAANAAPLIGAAVSDGGTMLFEQVDFRRGAGSVVQTAMAVIHGSPNSVDPGTVIFRSCSSNDSEITGSKGLVQVLKSTPGSHRHILVVDDCRTGTISWGNTTSPNDGLPGWVARGRMSGLTIPAELLAA